MPDARRPPRETPPESLPSGIASAMPYLADVPAVRRAGERLVSGRISRERFDAIVAAERRRFVRRRVREVAAALRA